MARWASAALCFSILLEARSVAALGEADRTCRPGPTTMVLWAEQVWQQEVVANKDGQLGTIALYFIGPVEGAYVRLRRRTPRSDTPVLFETRIHLDATGAQSVSIDTTSAGIALTRGDTLVLEIEGVQPAKVGDGALVGTTSQDADCSGLLYQNGNRTGISPSLHIAFTTYVCPGHCDGPSEASVVVAPFDTSLFVAPVRDEPPRQRQAPVLDRGLGLPPPKRERGAGFFHVGAQGQVVSVGLADAKLDGGGAATAHLTTLGHREGFSYRVRGSGTLGAQTSGLATRVDGDIAVGKAFYLGETANLFVRGGGRMDIHADGELDATVYSFPSISGGVQLTSPSVVFELSPHAAAAQWALYGTGSGTERYRRSSTIAPLWGGSAVLISQYGLFDVGLDRVEEAGGLWAVRGRLCTIVADPFPFARLTACAWGQYWTARVAGTADARDRRDVDSSAVGLGLGIGDVGHSPKDDGPSLTTKGRPSGAVARRPRAW